MPTISSKVSASRTFGDIGNLCVEVWIIKPGQDSILGSSVNNTEGRFSIVYDRSIGTQLFVKIYQSDQLIKNTIDKPVTIDRNRIPDIVIDGADDDPADTRSVKGIVATSKG